MVPTLLHLVAINWINFVIQPIPKRAVSTYVELLIGAVLSGNGHVTDAMLEVGHRKHFTTYYKMLQVGQWSWMAVVRQLVRLMVSRFPRLEWNLVIDDFLVPRASILAPGVRYHHEHSTKPNRPRYIWGQQWVALGVVLQWGRICVCIPLMLRLHKKVGNTSKIKRATMLVKIVLPWFHEVTNNIMMRVLVDSWYMKRTFIMPMIEAGVHVIGQVRKDTALFFVPTPRRKTSRGAPRKYGKRIDQHDVDNLKLFHNIFDIYGKRQTVKFKYTTCVARFLKATQVIAVWCQLENQKGWTLILSTDLALTPERIIKLYSRRWKTEPMFNEIKHWFGLTHAWEQSSRALHRWTSIICLSYAINRLLSLISQSKTFVQFQPTVQWRPKAIPTAGLIRLGLKIFFRHFGFYELWDSKSKKLIVPGADTKHLILSKL